MKLRNDSVANYSDEAGDTGDPGDTGDTGDILAL
jgi:hypothetical protein